MDESNWLHELLLTSFWRYTCFISPKPWFSYFIKSFFSGFLWTSLLATSSWLRCMSPSVNLTLFRLSFSFKLFASSESSEIVTYYSYTTSRFYYVIVGMVSSMVCGIGAGGGLNGFGAWVVETTLGCCVRIGIILRLVYRLIWYRSFGCGDV